MNLLPRVVSEFRNQGYWDEFFRKTGPNAFEWYGEFLDHCDLLCKYIKRKDNVLVIGAGNSRLSADLYDFGINSIDNIDISDTVVKQMNNQHAKQRPKMTYQLMDASQMTFQDQTYNVVIDKGTIDAIVSSTSAPSVEEACKIFDEISRVLKLGGRFICISLSQSFVLKTLLDYFAKEDANSNWAIRVHWKMLSGNTEKSQFPLPTFIFVFTKFKIIPGMPKILEFCHFPDQITRESTIEDLQDSVKGRQGYEIITNRIHKTLDPSAQHTVFLFSGTSLPTIPRYTITVVDGDPQSSNGVNFRFAIFIVPQGRETEWLFSTDSGRQHLRSISRFNRLAVVTLDRNHTYFNLDSIKEELTEKIMDLAPSAMPSHYKTPFLSVGDDIGNRILRASADSQFSGKYIVEDIELPNAWSRRLVFLSSQNVIQSECILKVPSSYRHNDKRNKKSHPRNFHCDVMQLAAAHHPYMMAGLALLPEFTSQIETSLNVLLVGLGGGCLANFIHRAFPLFTIDVVELDPEMLNVAMEWFEFKPSDRLNVIVEDGLEYIKRTAVSKPFHYHVIMFDVDSKDQSGGLSCPPTSFIKPPLLKSVTRLLNEEGVFVLNLVSRDENASADVKLNVAKQFNNICAVTIDEAVNEIVYAFSPEYHHKVLSLENNNYRGQLQYCLRGVQDFIRSAAKGSNSASDICNTLENLKLL